MLYYVKVGGIKGISTCKLPRLIIGIRSLNIDK